jgi:hypothetical protein
MGRLLPGSSIATIRLSLASLLAALLLGLAACPKQNSAAERGQSAMPQTTQGHSAPAPDQPASTAEQGTLAERIAEFKASRTPPPEIKKTMEEEESKLHGIAANAVKAGDQAPDFTLPSTSGEQFHLSEMLARGPVVLIFFRGSW